MVRRIIVMPCRDNDAVDRPAGDVLGVVDLPAHAVRDVGRATREGFLERRRGMLDSLTHGRAAVDDRRLLVDEDGDGGRLGDHVAGESAGRGVRAQRGAPNANLGPRLHLRLLARAVTNHVTVHHEHHVLCHVRGQIGDPLEIP